MSNPTAPPRGLFAIAIAAFGVQQLVYDAFVTRLIPKLPEWIPWLPFWAGASGLLLIVMGIALFWNKQTRATALTLAAIALASALLLHLPRVLADPRAGGLWTNTGKAVALAGGALLIGGVPWGRYLLGAFFVLGGVQHFIYPQFVAQLVPGWIPWHLFWTYFAAVALIAGGLGLSFKVPYAALLSGCMLLAWVVLLHIPRALADLHNSNEMTAVFEACAMGAAAFLAVPDILQRDRIDDAH